MAAKVGKRIEVRLDDEYREKLERILECRGTTLADFVRRAIDEADAAEAIRRLEKAFAHFDDHPLDLPDDPDELNRWLDETYDPTVDDPELRAFVESDRA